MISLNLPKGAVAVGCGYLYAMPVADFKLFETTWETMTEIGYITEDGATFTRSAESNPLVTANYGKIGSTPSDYTTEFDTGVISLTKENLTVFSTGATTEDLTDGGYRMKFGEDDTPAEVALCFRCTDLKKGKYFNIYMPNAQWVPELEWTFNATDALALNMHYSCSNAITEDGEKIAAYLETNLGVAEA